MTSRRRRRPVAVAVCSRAVYQLIRRRRHCGFTQRPLTSMRAHHSPCRSTNDGSFAALPPWCHGAMPPCRHAAKVPCRHAALPPWCHGAMVPWCRGAMVPCGRAAGNWMNYHSRGINLHAVQRRPPPARICHAPTRLAAVFNLHSSLRGVYSCIWACSVFAHTPSMDC